jgi:UDP-N-acetylmuramate dehydrogenase
VLGGGSNVLFPDEGFHGAVLVTQKLRGIRIDGLTASAMCGESLTGFARCLNRAGLSGMEWACGIPGTVGGAVAMNAGAYGRDMADVLSSVRVLTVNGVMNLPAEQLQLAYRSSALRAGTLNGIVVEATFELQEADPQRCLDREHEVLDMRARTQPVGASSGCIFKNPKAGPTAGELLDQAGCKGMHVGKAIVSAKHANFILNEGENNADDVLKLIQQMRQRVLAHHNVTLALEVILPLSNFGDTIRNT